MLKTSHDRRQVIERRWVDRRLHNIPVQEERRACMRRTFERRSGVEDRRRGWDVRLMTAGLWDDK